MTKEQLPGGGTVFGIGRRKTQGQLAKAELNQGIGHLRQAATYAAKGAGATVGPRAVIARDRASSGFASTVAALAPLALAVRNAQAQTAGKALTGRKAAAAKQTAMSKKAKARNLKAAKKQKKSGSMMTGLLAAGAVAGVAGAMAMRRRREQQEWAEYDPTQGVETVRDEVDTLVVETPSANGGKVTDSSTMSSGAGTAGGPTGAGSSAVAGGDSASTTTPGTQPVIHANDKVPSVAEGATDVSGRPADDLSKAIGKNGAKSSSRR
ncbi:hypothetical protein AB0I37_05605 [Micromonospora purpureochromogenes]|uniref:hypothetical protein n=1 Tax=Micromonospora purpureochromogenes TaxID=47872 RepID=UPI0033C4ED93